MKKHYQRLYLQRAVQAGIPDTEDQEAARQRDSDPTPDVGTADIRRAINNPRTARPETITAMQQTYGNRAVQRLISSSRSAKSTTSHSGPAVIQRVIDDRVQSVINENPGGHSTNQFI